MSDIKNKLDFLVTSHKKLTGSTLTYENAGLNEDEMINHLFDYAFKLYYNFTLGVDFNEYSFSHSFDLTQSIGNHFLPAYLPIVERRKNIAFGERQRQFQLFRRGRYVEFNLVHDRGTRFGLQSGGRTPSILISLPPQATWRYEWPTNRQDTPEERLSTEFLQPRNWIVDS